MATLGQPSWGSHLAGALGSEIRHGIDFGHSSARVCQLAGHRDRRGRRPTRFTEVTFTKEKYVVTGSHHR